MSVPLDPLLLALKGKWMASKRVDGRQKLSVKANSSPSPAKSINNNGFDSRVPGDTETDSKDSVDTTENGRLLEGNRPSGSDAPVGDWSGGWMPPSIGRDARPRFDNDCEEFVGEFGRWKETA
jgi:hypothetical protein